MVQLTNLVGLLEVDRDLGRGIEQGELDQARRLVVGRRENVPLGPWDADSISNGDDSFAALVVEGLLTRERAIAGSVYAEIFGPGDVIDRSWEDTGMVPSSVRWSAATPTTLAVLDRRFIAAVRRWPVLSLRLYERVAEQGERASVLSSINAIRNVEQRVLAVLWHLAGLYGKVRTGGDVVLPIRLSHEAIGRLVGARRPTVTLAMKVLSEGSLVTAEEGVGFVLREGSRSTLEPAAPPPAGAGLGGIAGLESLERAARTPAFSGDSPETRALGRLREQVSVLRESEGGLRAIFELAAIGVALLDGYTGEMQNVNDRLAEILGTRKRELGRTSLWDRVHPEDRAVARDAVAPVLAQSQTQAEAEFRMIGASGSEVWIRADFAMLEPGERPTLIAVFQDITERRSLEEGRRRNAERDALRVKVSDAIASVDDPLEKQMAVVTLLGRHLEADRCFVGEPEEGPKGEAVEVGRDYHREGISSLVGSYPLADAGEQFREMYGNEQTWMTSDIHELVDADERLQYEAIGVRAVIAVPMARRGAWFSTLAVCHGDPREWTVDEIALVEETAGRLRASIEREQIDREREERAALDAYWVALIDALREADDPAKIQAAACQILGDHLEADRCYAAEVEEGSEDQFFTIHRDYRREHLPSMAGRYAAKDFGVTDMLAKRMISDDVWESTAEDSKERESFDAGGLRAFIHIPLFDGDEWIGAMTVAQTEPRAWTPAQVGLAEDTAARVAGAVARERSSRALHESEERFRLMFDSIDEGFAVTDVVYDEEGSAVDLLQILGNPAANRINAGAFDGALLVRDLGADPALVRLAAGVVSTGEPRREVSYDESRDRWFEFFLAPIDGGSRARVAWLGSDVTERRRREEATRLSDEIASDLARLSDPADVMKAVGSRLLEAFSAAKVSFVEIDEAAATATVIQDVAEAGVPSATGTHDLDAYYTAESMEAMRATPILAIDDVAEHALTRGHAKRWREWGIESSLSAQIVSDGRLRFQIAVQRSTPSRWTNDAANQLSHVAERIHLQIQRARAEKTVRENEERQALLLGLSDAVGPLNDPVAIQTEACRVLRMRLEAQHVTYWGVTAQETVIARAEDLAPGRTPYLGNELPLGDYEDGLAEELRSGGAAWRDDVTDASGVSEAQRAAYAEAKTRSWAVVPLIREGELAAALGVNFADAHAWAESEIRLIEEVAQRTWAAVEQSRAERAMLEGEERYRGLLETMQQGFCTMERVEQGPLDFRYLLANPAFERLTGQTDVIGKTVRELDPEVEEEILEAHDRVLRSGIPDRFEVHAWGRWFEGEVVPTSEPNQVAVQFADIGERKWRENERFRALVEATTAMVWETDAEGRVVEDSPSWREFTGQTYDEWIGAGWMQVVHPDDRERAGRNWRESVEREVPVDTRFRIWHAASEEWRPTRVQAVPTRDASGAISGWIGMNREIGD